MRKFEDFSTQIAFLATNFKKRLRIEQKDTVKYTKKGRAEVVSLTITNPQKEEEKNVRLK